MSIKKELLNSNTISKKVGTWKYGKANQVDISKYGKSLGKIHHKHNFDSFIITFDIS